MDFAWCRMCPAWTSHIFPLREHGIPCRASRQAIPAKQVDKLRLCLFPQNSSCRQVPRPPSTMHRLVCGKQHLKSSWTEQAGSQFSGFEQQCRQSTGSQRAMRSARSSAPPEGACHWWWGHGRCKPMLVAEPFRKPEQSIAGSCL